VVKLLITNYERFIAETVSDFFKSVNIWQSYQQERGCIVHFVLLTTTLLEDKSIRSAVLQESPTCPADKPTDRQTDGQTEPHLAPVPSAAMQTNISSVIVV